jgi:type IV pilus assembly protein PilX
MKPKKITHTPMKTKQSGIALIFVLLILVIVSLLGIGGAQLAMMGERGARNERDTQIAKQYAEAALMDAEFDIKGNYAGATKIRADVFDSEMNFEEGCGTTGNTKGLCAQSLSSKPVWLTVNFTAKTNEAHYVTIGEFTDRKVKFSKGIQPALEPRYIVEIVPDSTVGTELGLKAKKKTLHRITAMGFGPRDDIQTVLQTVYRKE